MAEAQAERPPEDSLQDQAEVPQQAATDLRDLPTGPRQAMIILPARREAQAATLQAGVQVHILPAAQAVAVAVIPAAGSPVADHPEVQVVRTAVAEAPEAVAEEGNH